MRINKSLITFTPTSGSGSGTVTSVAMSATMPTGLTASISGSPITSSGTLGLTLTFTAGYSIPITAKQTEWDTAFSNRITSLTITGSSGAATLVSNVLNIPNYTLSGLGGVPTTRTITINGTSFDLSANRTFSVGTVTSVAALTIGTTSTDITSSVANGTTTPVITLNIPTASATNRGALSSTDWLTFSSKQPAITLTTTGNSGSSTLIGATLNVPTYTLVGLGGMSNPFSAAIGQIIYSNSAGAPLSLLGNTTTTKRFLSQTGDGTLSAAPFWSTIAIGDVSGAISLTALSATSPLLYNNTTGVFSIQQASNLQSGFLAAADWTTFNSKQTQITLTTTGSSGASTFNFSTGALNIPQYTLAGLGGLSNPMTSLGDMIYGNSAGAPQRLAPNITTTRKYLSMVGDGSSGAIPTWEAISGIAGSGTTNYIAKFTGASTVGNSIIAETSGLVTIYGDGQTYRGQSGAGLTSIFITNDDNTFGNRHETKISTQQLGSGLGRTIIQAASYNTSTNRGELAILTESGANFVANIGTLITGVNNAFSLYSTSFSENVRLNTGGDSFINSGNLVIGTTVANARLQVNGGTLATSGSGFMVSSGLTNGRLETYQSGTANCIHTVLDRETYEISCGSTSGWVSGIVITGRDASLLPDRVAIYTRNVQRFQIGGTGQLQLNNYTSASSFTGTPTAYLACDSSGNIITSNPSSGRSIRLAFSAEVPNTWSNMPSTLQFFDSSSAYVTQIDLTYYNQVRLIVNKQGTAGATGSKLLIRYQATTGAPFTESSYLAIGTSEVSLAVDTTNNILTTSWIDLASGAKSDVWVALMGIDGDTTADPVFGNIYAEFRFV
jgi:hypothetical protein